MMTFPEPPAIQVSGKPLPMRAYLSEVILTLPYWRSTEEAMRQAEEIFCCIDGITGGAPAYRIKDTTHEALQQQMKLADQNLVQMNPHLARLAIRYGLVVSHAEKYVEPDPFPA